MAGNTPPRAAVEASPQQPRYRAFSRSRTTQPHCPYRPKACTVITGREMCAAKIQSDRISTTSAASVQCACFCPVWIQLWLDYIRVKRLEPRSKNQGISKQWLYGRCRTTRNCATMPGQSFFLCQLGSRRQNPSIPRARSLKHSI